MTSSDIRLKSVFFDIPNVLDKLEGISAFYYTMKEDEDKILASACRRKPSERFFRRRYNS